jgi:transcriptional regulator CtsR
MVSYPNSSIMKIAILTLLFITNLYCYDNNGNTKESSRENSLSTSKSDNPTILDSIQNNFKSKIKDQISPYFLNREFDGYILVKRDEKMVISESFTSEQNVMTDITPFMIGSVTKSFTAELISTLREKGLLTEKTKLIDLITSLDTDIYKDITVYDLLTHSSGIPDYYNIDTFKEVPNFHLILNPVSAIVIQILAITCLPML